MAGLPNNTFAAPGVSFYAAAGGGAASTLQSPVAILPAVDGSVAVVAQGTLNGNATLSALADGVGNGNAAINVGADGIVYSMSVSGSGGILAIGVNGAPQPAILYEGTPGNDELVLGTGGAGTIRTQNAFVALDKSIDPTEACGVYIAPTSATTTVIENTIASSGTLSLGSSQLTNQLVLSDTGAGTAKVAVGGNSGSSITMTGGAGGSQIGIINTSATGVGSLLLGASAVNDRAIFINDTGGGANSAVVDITGGTATGVALRLRGYGAGSAAIISTNAGAGGVLNIQNNVTEASPNMVMTDASTTLNGLVLVPNDLSFVGSGSITAFQTFLTSGVVCGDNTTAGIPNPAGLAIGLYMVLARGTIGGVSSVACSVSTISYWDGSSWKWGGGGAAPALVTAPPSYIGIQGGGATLVLGNGGGLGTVTMDFTYLKLGGNLGI